MTRPRCEIEGCQLPTVPRLATGALPLPAGSPVRRLKAALAKPWNTTVKKWLKQLNAVWLDWRGPSAAPLPAQDAIGRPPLAKGDLVRVRSREEILATLDRFSELKGCALLPQMWDYCGTEHRVFRYMQRFLDERDYKMKKVSGVVLLEELYCNGTIVFGGCDRACFLFWREEWLERVETGPVPVEGG